MKERQKESKARERWGQENVRVREKEKKKMEKVRLNERKTKRN